MKKIYGLIIIMLISCSGTRPELGVKDSKLSICPDSPNCVISYENSPDDEHFIDPFKYVGSKENTYQKIIKILENEGQAQITVKKPDYIRAEFTSTIFRFVDDVEFLFTIDDSNLVHVRSGARIGHSDMGVNRKRIEMIRFKYHQNDY